MNGEEREICSICRRIDAIREKRHPRFIAELASGYLCLGDHQLYPGYCLFFSKTHAREIPDLDEMTCRLFLWEMSRVASALLAVCRPRKLNYEMLGNQDAHLHWHLFPRYPGDPGARTPVWSAIEEYVRINPPASLGMDKTLAPDDESMKRKILDQLHLEPVTVVSRF